MSEIRVAELMAEIARECALHDGAPTIGARHVHAAAWRLGEMLTHARARLIRTLPPGGIPVTPDRQMPVPTLDADKPTSQDDGNMAAMDAPDAGEAAIIEKDAPDERE